MIWNISVIGDWADSADWQLHGKKRSWPSGSGEGRFGFGFWCRKGENVWMELYKSRAFFWEDMPSQGGGASDSSIILKPSLSRCWWWIRSYEMLFFWHRDALSNQDYIDIFFVAKHVISTIHELEISMKESIFQQKKGSQGSTAVFASA